MEGGMERGGETERGKRGENEAWIVYKCWQRNENSEKNPIN
jgi:hypothetical protein